MKLDQFQKMNKPDEFFEVLVQRALEGKQSDFEFIRNYKMLRVAKLYKKGVRKVSRLFESIRKSLLKQYQATIKSGTQDIKVIMSITQFEKCRDYYKKERAIAKDMISEYRTYVFSGHILDTLLGKIRPDNECVDFRTLPIKWF